MFSEREKKRERHIERKREREGGRDWFGTSEISVWDLCRNVASLAEMHAFYKFSPKEDLKLFRICQFFLRILFFSRNSLLFYSQKCIIVNAIKWQLWGWYGIEGWKACGMCCMFALMEHIWLKTKYMHKFTKRHILLYHRIQQMFQRNRILLRRVSGKF